MTTAGPFYEFTCDRCGAFEKHAASGPQPVGWTSVWLSSPPLMSPVEDKNAIRKHACIDCSPLIEAFISGKDDV